MLPASPLKVSRFSWTSLHRLVESFASVRYLTSFALECTVPLSSTARLDFVGLLVSKATGNAVPTRFVSFLLVGALGVLVHLVSLKAFLTLGFEFVAAQIFATLVAMTSNFFLNNALTYRDQQLTAGAALKGLLLFYLICSVSAASNVGVAIWLYSNKPVWWLAGLLGSVVGAVWNYAVSSTIVWRRLSPGALPKRSTVRP